MNKEYILTDNGNVFVTDEYGKIDERKVDCGDVEKELILENNMEYLDSIIYDLKTFISTEHTFNKSKYLSNFEAPFIATLMGAAVGGLYSQNELTVPVLTVGGACCGLSLVYTGISNVAYAKGIKTKKEAYSKVLFKAVLLKQDIVDEIDELRNDKELKHNFTNVSTTILPDQEFIFNATQSLKDEFNKHIKSKKLKREFLSNKTDD